MLLLLFYGNYEFFAFFGVYCREFFGKSDLSAVSCRKEISVRRLFNSKASAFFADDLCTDNSVFNRTGNEECAVCSQILEACIIISVP